MCNSEVVLKAEALKLRTEYTPRSAKHGQRINYLLTEMLTS